MKYLKIIFMFALLGVVGCGGGSPSISIQPSIENFSESSPQNIQLDILWVVDPSRSMFEETENVKANISSFMEDIVNADYNYRVGVISSAAWSDLAYQQEPLSREFLVDDSNNPVFNRLHKGECNDYNSSQSNPNTFLSPLNAPDLTQFLESFDTYFDIYGAKLGTSGCGLVGPPFGTFQSVSNNIFADPRFNTSERTVLGEYLNDERPLQSLEAFLQSSAGQNFVRDEAFLAVVIITDEPDGSRNDLSPSPTFDPQAPGVHEASRYINILNQVKGSSANYAVYSIIKQDGSNTLNEAIANQTGGETVNIDGSSADYAAGLTSIQQSIIEESSLYLFDSTPIVETIQVTLIKGSTGEIIQVPVDTGSGGFLYLPGVNGIKFIPPFVVENGDNLQVVYDKTSFAGGGTPSQPIMNISNNLVSESAPNGQSVGQLSVTNVSEVTGISYSLDNDSSNGGFSVTPSGEVLVEDSSLLDREAQPLQSLEITATGSGNFEIEANILIILSDAIDASPSANNDQFTVSEASANNSGDISVTGNVSSNDAGIDTSENHTFQLISGPTPNLGNASLNNSGVFSYLVNRTDLNLSSGDQEIITFTYQISDSSANTSNIGTITVTIQGLNEPPVNDVALNDIVATGGGTTPVLVNLVAETNSGLASGNLDDATDGNPGTGFVTSALANQAHFVTYEMEDLGQAGDELYQVTSVSFDGAHSMGNTVIQVLSEQDQVLSREVLSITTGNQTGAVNFSTPAIGRKVRLIRPSGAINSDSDDDLQVNEITVNGILADIIRIDLDDHFTDPDDPSPGALSYYATDVNGEGPAPGWANINGTELVMVPPAGTDMDIGIVAEDISGATDFITFNVTRAGGGSLNSGPIALLAIDDTQRGGLTLKRYGGGPGNCGNIAGDPGSNSDQYITWDEGDDFIDQLLDENGEFIYPGAGQFDHLLSGNSGTDGHSTIEDGWSPVATTTLNKYSSNGRILPLDDTFNNSERCYGEAYTGYFVPDRTGLYRFRTNTLDDIVRLLVSTGEYTTELTNVITGTIDTGTMRAVTEESTNSGANFLGLDPQVDGPTNEFFPGTEGNALGSGHDTSVFFAGGVLGYQPGYIYLEEGNVYTFQIRFMEGGGQQRFDFEFDYREDGGPSGNWENAWRPIDAVVTVPFSGSEGYTPQIVTSQPFVAFNSSELFYDAELDVLEYDVEMVNADGSPYLGPGGTSNVGEIGLSFNSTTGFLSGSLNAVYNNAATKPRVQFTATERFTPAQQSVQSLVIKFD